MLAFSFYDLVTYLALSIGAFAFPSLYFISCARKSKAKPVESVFNVNEPAAKPAGAEENKVTTAPTQQTGTANAPTASVPSGNDNKADSKDIKSADKPKSKKEAVANEEKKPLPAAAENNDEYQQVDFQNAGPPPAPPK